MLTAEIKVNGRLVSVVYIRNIGGARGPELEGIANYKVESYGDEAWLSIVRYGMKRLPERTAFIQNWDRSRPAHELVHAAIEAIMEAGK